MNLGIIRKTTRDTLVLLLIVILGITAFEMLLVGMIGEFYEDSQLWLQKTFVQRFVKAMLGAELGVNAGAMGFVAIGFAHTLLYALTWALLLTTCSRVIAAEIEQGTADLLLTLPVSRASVYVSVSAVWIPAGVPVSLAVLLGTWIGASAFTLWEPLNYARLAILTVNLFALYLAIGSATMLVSSFLSRRAPAVAIVLACLLASFLLNFLGQFWSAFEHISFLGILRYYRPLPVVQTGDWPVRDIAVLLGLGAILWSAGLWRFARRDIPAV